MATLTLQQKIDIKKLSAHPLIKYVKYNYFNVCVRFKSGIKENWILRSHSKYKNWVDIPKHKPWFISNNIEFNEFETNPFDQTFDIYNNIHFSIPQSAIQKAGIGDIQTKIHELVIRLTTEGWVDLKYPDSVLANKLEILKQCPYEKFYNKNRNAIHSSLYIRPIGARYMVLPIIAHFIPVGTIKSKHGRMTASEVWNSRKMMYRIISYLAHSNKHDITRLNILANMGASNNTYADGFNMVMPHGYVALFKHVLKLDKPVVFDYHIECYSKAIATGLVGGTYVNKDVCNKTTALVKYCGGDTSTVLHKEPDVVFITGFRQMFYNALIDRIKTAPKSRYTIINIRKNIASDVIKIIKPTMVLSVIPGNWYLSRDVLLIKDNFV